MRIRSPRIWLALVLSLSWLQAIAGAFEDMVAFDRSYIGALALTSQAAAEPAKGTAAARAMERLNEAWPKLRDAPSIRGEPALARVLPQVAADIAKATRHVAARQWYEAHEALEPVRMRFMAARERAGIGYYPDLLTAFHEPMEAIVLAAKDKTPASFGPKERGAIGEHLAAVLALWHKVEATRLDPAAYRLAAPQAERAAKLVADERAALDRLNDAVRGGDPATLIRAATAIKPPFAQLYMLFGDLGT